MVKQIEDTRTRDMYDPDNCAQYENGACIGHVIGGRAYYWGVPSDADIMRAAGKQDGDTAPKRRGRPSIGSLALSAAERKRRQRERDRHAFTAIEGETGKKAPHDMSVTALIENLQHAVSKGWAIDARELADELVKRARANRDA